MTARAPLGTIPLFLRAGAVIPMLPRTVDTLSDYGTGVVHLADQDGRRTLLAAPVAGTSHGTLGPDETLTSQATGAAWTLQLDASRARTYDMQRDPRRASRRTWEPCRVEADGQKVPVRVRRRPSGC